MLDLEAIKRALRDVTPSDEALVPVECYCQRADGSRPQHGPHWVPARRLKKGGDLRGRVKVLAGFEA